MSLLVNLLVGAAVFAYAFYHLYRFVQQGAKAKCRHCGLKESCSTKTCSLDGEASQRDDSSGGKK
ncbi:MAG: FeoB-associated Cys-rich membrane protein [Bacillaceae bacterium]|nr:FeoB-associated Cys-rich membrane protein [Bacillaceae bacterium]